MKVLIYGSNGWIGSQFIQILEENTIIFTCGQSRADNYDSLLEEIEINQPSHVVSFIGRTHGKIDEKIYTTIDYLEQEGKLVENVRDNLYSPLLLAMICKERNIHYTYLGTGCIFKFDDVQIPSLTTTGSTATLLTVLLTLLLPLNALQLIQFTLLRLMLIY